MCQFSSMQCDPQEECIVVRLVCVYMYMCRGAGIKMIIIHSFIAQ